MHGVVAAAEGGRGRVGTRAGRGGWLLLLLLGVGLEEELAFEKAGGVEGAAGGELGFVEGDTATVVCIMLAK